MWQPKSANHNHYQLHQYKCRHSQYIRPSVSVDSLALELCVHLLKLFHQNNTPLYTPLQSNFVYQKLHLIPHLMWDPQLIDCAAGSASGGKRAMWHNLSFSDMKPFRVSSPGSRSNLTVVQSQWRALHGVDLPASVPELAAAERVVSRLSSFGFQKREESVHSTV